MERVDKRTLAAPPARPPGARPLLRLRQRAHRADEPPRRHARLLQRRHRSSSTPRRSATARTTSRSTRPRAGAPSPRWSAPTAAGRRRATTCSWTARSRWAPTVPSASRPAASRTRWSSGAGRSTRASSPRTSPPSATPRRRCGAGCRCRATSSCSTWWTRAAAASSTRASTALIYPRARLSTPKGWEDFLTLASHEYFHLWNVKRLKPRAFVPFDYADENYTRLLWAFEGITSYYDNLLVRRAGRMSPAALPGPARRGVLGARRDAGPAGADARGGLAHRLGEVLPAGRAHAEQRHLATT